MTSKRAKTISVAAATGLCTLIAGCSNAPLGPTYGQAELQVICERQGGWWRDNQLTGGYCEYQAPDRMLPR